MCTLAQNPELIFPKRLCSAMLGCCAVLLVPLLAVLIGSGLVIVDVKPLFAFAGKALPSFVPKDAKAVPNSEVRNFLLQAGLKGKAAASPQYEKLPLKGVFMFDQMGPAGWIDFSYVSSWDADKGEAVINMWDLTAPSGVPTPKYGGIGPYFPGGYLLAATEWLQYRVRFSCPPLQDGKYCLLKESVFGKPFADKDDQGGPMLWHMTQFDGGRKFVRDTWLVPPWGTADTSASKFHSYSLLKLMDANGAIDEENFQLFMEKLDGQDLLVPAAMAP